VSESFDPSAGRIYEVTEHYRGERLDRFLQAMIPRLSRQSVQRAIRARVALSWHKAPRAALKVIPGEKVLVRHAAVVEGRIDPPPPVLYEDASLLVVDKPAGLLVHPTHHCRRNNVINILRAHRPGEQLALAHRLDRETSGLLLLTRSVGASRFLAEEFVARRVSKTYRALAHGEVEADEGTFDAPLGVRSSLDIVFRRGAGGERAQPARTDFRVERRFPGYTLLALHPHTGRRHQIRAHLADAGHPIVGDKLYATDARFFLRMVRHGLDDAMRDRLQAPRQLLHAAGLAFRHPADGHRVRFTSPLPPDFEAFLDWFVVGGEARVSWDLDTS